MSRLFDTFGDGAEEAEFGTPLAKKDAGPPETAPLELSAHAVEALAAGDAFESLDSLAVLDTPPPAAPEVPENGEEPPAIAPKMALTVDEEPPSTPSTSYEIPDFEKDERDLTAYEDAKKRHIRQQISNAERDIQTAFAQKREQLAREVKNARSFEDERRGNAQYTTRQYAAAYPHKVDKKGITPPSFFENLFSFGRAGRLYRAAFLATDALEQLRAAIRKRDEALGALEGQLSRAIYLKEESIKKSMETQAGIDDFHDRPEIKPLYRRIDKINQERERFAKRLEKGAVSDLELRDRSMAEMKLAYATLPITGAIIARVARFGSFAYFQLRDLERKESLLTYDSRLDPLRNSVFDVYSVAGTVAAKIKRNDNGTAFRVADHFKACWRNQDKAEELYGQHRAALRDDRGLASVPPRDEAEAEIIERLAGLAIMVDGTPQPPSAAGGRST